MSWREVKYSTVPVDDPRLVRVVQLLKERFVNGGVILHIFAPIDNSAFDTAMNSDLQGTGHLLKTFLTSPSVRRGVRELRIPGPSSELPETTQFNCFEFEGSITGWLLSSGAYVNAELTEAEARRMSREFADALVDAERCRTMIWRIQGAWTRWFYDVAWDGSFIILNTPERRWAILCVTDTD